METPQSSNFTSCISQNIWYLHSKCLYPLKICMLKTLPKDEGVSGGEVFGRNWSSKRGFPMAPDDEESGPAITGDLSSNPWLWGRSWRRAWQPICVSSLPENFHFNRGAWRGYSPGLVGQSKQTKLNESYSFKCFSLSQKVIPRLWDLKLAMRSSKRSQVSSEDTVRVIRTRKGPSPETALMPLNWFTSLQNCRQMNVCGL